MMAMDSVDVEREMDGLFGDTEQGEQENATQSLTQEEADQREGGANLDVTGAEETKKKRVMRPQPKLDPDRLMGPRGLLALEDVFKDWEPRGKGREFDDLDVVMKKMEHWAHRLFPSLKFDEILEKIAGPLAKKKTVQCHVKKIRLGMVEPVREEVNVEEEKEEDVERYDGGGGGDDDDRDEFDEMLRQAGGQMAPPVMPAPGGGLVAPPVMAVPPRKTGGLTEEQKEKIRKNKEMAERKRKERLAAAAAADLVQDKPREDPVQDKPPENPVKDKPLEHGDVLDNAGDGRRIESEKEKSTNDDVLNLDEMMEEMTADDFSAGVEPEKEKSANLGQENESSLVSASFAESVEDKTNNKVVEKMDSAESTNGVESEKEKTTCDEELNLDEMMEEMDTE